MEASTVDELWDERVCRGAPASGRTTMTSSRHTVVITYDGALDCDEEQSAEWSRNGAAMGAIDGISCSASGRGCPSLALLALAAAGMVLLRRRRC